MSVFVPPADERETAIDPRENFAVTALRQKFMKDSVFSAHVALDFPGVVRC